MADATPPCSASLNRLVDWREFLTDYPPGTRTCVEGAIESINAVGRPNVAHPELQLTCDGCGNALSYCRGNIAACGKLFPGPEPKDVLDAILLYSCPKCDADVKSFSVRIIGDCQRLRHCPRAVEAAKLGEWPPFAPCTPSKVNSLVGPDRALFFKGRQAESAGLGVGAFAYYRRIVEDQKNRFLDEIIKVARRTDAPAETVALLEAAKSETQFSKAVGMVRDAVPPSLLIKGHNTLTLLHSALSRDLHGAADEECLAVAHDVRVILCEFAEKLSQALKDDKDLTDAVSRLLNHGT